LLPAASTRNCTPLDVVGIRGYYRDSMGAPGANDRGIDDDALCVVAAQNVFAADDGNTDPSAQYRTGLAALKPGVYHAHRLDLHRGRYMALCQRADDVIVHRDGTDNFKAGVDHDDYGHCLGNGYWRGWFGINIHCGSNTTTSSLGCQTIPPAQWDSFIATVMSEAKRLFGDAWRKRTIPYILVDQA